MRSEGRVRPGSRTVWAGLLVGLAFLLAGCQFLFPTRGNEEPLAATVRDGEVWFRWCGEYPTDTFNFIRVRYKSDETDAANGVIAAEGHGTSLLVPGQEFSTAVPPEGMTYSRSLPIPVSDAWTSIFVYTGASADHLDGIAGAIRASSLEALSDGQWLFTNGETVDEPCDV